MTLMLDGKCGAVIVAGKANNILRNKLERIMK